MVDPRPAVQQERGDSRPELSDAARKGGGGEGRTIRVLIVDDNVDLALGLARWLEISGLEVRVAHDGRSGVREAQAWLPDYVLVDIGLPGMDGYMVAADLRREPALARATIIAISGYGPEDAGPVSEGGWFDHHLVKPIDNAALLRLLTRTGPAGAHGLERPAR